MIEALIAYIEDQVRPRGYTVHVREHVIHLRKVIDDTWVLGYNWSFSTWYLQSCPKELLLQEADRIVAELFRAEALGRPASEEEREG